MAGFSFSLTPQKVPTVNTRYRQIQTRFPVPESLPLLTDLAKYESRSMHGQMPVLWDRAEDFQVYDPYGNAWIDFTSTIFVANSGHANPHIVTALRRMLDKKLLHTYTFAHEGRIQFLKRLVEISPEQFEKAFLLSAGTEATECAIKLMRMHGQSISKEKVGIISFQGSMHGRTMGAEMLKGDAKGSAWIGYQDPHIYHLTVPYPWSFPGFNEDTYDWDAFLQRNMQGLASHGLQFDTIAGFIVESYIGWSAYFFPKKLIQAIARFAKQHESLLTFDEIQSGFGRTGKLYAYQHYEVEPDMICLGKGLSASLPLSAVLGRRMIMDLPDVGSMSSTHSANPLCCAAGLANIETIISQGLVEESRKKGKMLHSLLKDLQGNYPDRISSLFGKGLVAAVIFKDPSTGDPDGIFASKVCEKAMQKGLLMVHTGRESIKIGPPLTIPEDALVEGIAVLRESIAEVITENE